VTLENHTPEKYRQSNIHSLSPPRKSDSESHIYAEVTSFPAFHIFRKNKNFRRTHIDMSRICTVQSVRYKQTDYNRKFLNFCFVLPEFRIRHCLEIFNVGHGTIYFTKKSNVPRKRS
jgi:hypothetical protein